MPAKIPNIKLAAFIASGRPHHHNAHLQNGQQHARQKVIAEAFGGVEHIMIGHVNWQNLTHQLRWQHAQLAGKNLLQIRTVHIQHNLAQSQLGHRNHRQLRAVVKQQNIRRFTSQQVFVKIRRNNHTSQGLPLLN